MGRKMSSDREIKRRLLTKEGGEKKNERIPTVKRVHIQGVERTKANVCGMNLRIGKRFVNENESTEGHSGRISALIETFSGKISSMLESGG